MMLPPRPEVPAAQRGTGTYPVRFEDLTQDGRLRFDPIVTSIGAAIWVPILARHPLSATLQASGVRAVFTRLAIEGTDARIDLGTPLTADGTYELAHERAADGGVARLYLNMWTDVWAPRRGTKERALVGRLFAEHVLTRPLAPPGERRVTTVPGLDVPTAHYAQPRLDDLLTLPSDAGGQGEDFAEAALSLDATPCSFGLVHTDMNQHVNSLVYPRLFEDAALRRFAALGKSTTVLSRTLEIAFRKPFFAGQTARVALRTAVGGAGASAVGVFVDASDVTSDAPLGSAKPHTYVRVGFQR